MKAKVESKCDWAAASQPPSPKLRRATSTPCTRLDSIGQRIPALAAAHLFTSQFEIRHSKFRRGSAGGIAPAKYRTAELGSQTTLNYLIPQLQQRDQ